jgi:calcineurin-like phosphoesterase family protein
VTTWFTADLHLNHAKIIEYCDRPFSDVDHMNTTLVNNYQAVVEPGDDVFILGDFALSGHHHFARRLPGQKHLLFGNHDNKTRKKFTTWGFAWAKDVYELRIKRDGSDPIYIWLSHYSHQSWPRSFHGSWHLFGHSHGRLPGYGLSLDVGVDSWGYAPVSLKTIEKEMKKLQSKFDAENKPDR